MIGDHFLDCHSFDTKFMRMFENFLTKTEMKTQRVSIQPYFNITRLLAVGKSHEIRILGIGILHPPHDKINARFAQNRKVGSGSLVSL